MPACEVTHFLLILGLRLGFELGFGLNLGLMEISDEMQSFFNLWYLNRIELKGAKNQLRKSQNVTLKYLLFKFDSSIGFALEEAETDKIILMHWRVRATQLFSVGESMVHQECCTTELQLG